MNQSRSAFPIIGIGASAGGLAPIEEFFDHMPNDSGMAFVIVQHLSPDFKSLMDELLARHTKMTIHKVTDGIVVEPDSIYLIPPEKNMVLADGKLLLSDQDPVRGSVRDWE
jgi:two-component system CheB/CheR fusion protein